MNEERFVELDAHPSDCTIEPTAPVENTDSAPVGFESGGRHRKVF